MTWFPHVSAILQMEKLRLREVQFHVQGQGTTEVKEFEFELRPSESKALSRFVIFVFYLLKFSSQKKLLFTTINENPMLGKGKNKCNEN